MSVNWMVTWHPDRALTAEERELHLAGKGAHVCDYAPATSEAYGDVRTAANRDKRLRHGLGGAPHPHGPAVFPGFGVQDQAIQESQGAVVRSHAGASRHERRGDHPLCAGGSWPRRKRSATTGRRRPSATPESFFVRSASVVLPHGGRTGSRARWRSFVANAGRPPDARLSRRVSSRMAGRARPRYGRGRRHRRGQRGGCSPRKARSVALVDSDRQRWRRPPPASRRPSPGHGSPLQPPNLSVEAEVQRVWTRQ